MKENNIYILQRKPSYLNYNKTKIKVYEAKITFRDGIRSKGFVHKLSEYFKVTFSQLSFLETRLIVSTEVPQHYRLRRGVIGNGNVLAVVTQ